LLSKFCKKKLKKICKGLKSDYLCPPQKGVFFLEENGVKIKKKYFFSIYLRVNKKDVLLHPLTER